MKLKLGIQASQLSKARPFDFAQGRLWGTQEWYKIARSEI
jgi:hypothetical protein